MKNGAKSQKPSSKIEQLGSLAGFIVDFLSTILNFDQVKYWLDHKNLLKKKLREVFSITDEFFDVREDWKNFYKTNFNWDVDFSLVLIPNRPEGNFRLLFIAKGMTMNRAFDRCKALFKSWRYNDDLDTAIPKNIRTASEHYAVWVRDGVEPDVEHLGKSTNQVDPDMKIGVTVLERVILELKYFSETGNHLDIKGVTFCSGSRYSGGGVPRAYWYGDKFKVNWCSLDYSDSVDGVRSVVSL